MLNRVSSLLSIRTLHARFYISKAWIILTRLREPHRTCHSSQTKQESQKNARNNQTRHGNFGNIFFFWGTGAGVPLHLHPDPAVGGGV